MSDTVTPPFLADSVASGALTVIAPQGELVVDVTPELRQAVERALTSNPLIVALDLRGLTFIDSYGVRSLIAASQTLHADGRQLFLIRGAPHINRLLRAAGLYGAFDVVSDLDHLGFLT